MTDFPSKNLQETCCRWFSKLVVTCFFQSATKIADFFILCFKKMAYICDIKDKKMANSPHKLSER